MRKANNLISTHIDSHNTSQRENRIRALPWHLFQLTAFHHTFLLSLKFYSHSEIVSCFFLIHLFRPFYYIDILITLHLLWIVFRNLTEWGKLWQGLSICQAFRFLLFSLCERQNPQMTNSFFWLINTKSGLLAKIGWSICISKSNGIFWVTFSMTASGLCL